MLGEYQLLFMSRIPMSLSILKFFDMLNPEMLGYGDAAVNYDFVKNRVID